MNLKSFFDAMISFVITKMIVPSENVFSEHREVMMEMMLSNGCVAEERVKLSDIVEQFAEFFLEKKAGRKQEKQARQEREADKPRKKRARPRCCKRCNNQCKPVCTRECYWDCDYDYEDDCYYGDEYSLDLIYDG